jgi:hypothetical protein
MALSKYSTVTTTFVGPFQDTGGAEFNVRAYGAKGDGKQSAVKSDTVFSINSGSATLSASNQQWTAPDVGKLITVSGAGASGSDLKTTIQSFTNGSTIVLAATAGTTVSTTGSATWGGGTINSSSASLNVPNANFSSVDVGKLITVQGAGAAGLPLYTTIASVIDSSHVTLTNTASTTVYVSQVDWGSDDRTAIQAAINAASVSGGVVIFPGGYTFIIDGVGGRTNLGVYNNVDYGIRVNASNVILRGYGATVRWLHPPVSTTYAGVLFGNGGGTSTAPYIGDNGTWTANVALLGLTVDGSVLDHASKDNPTGLSLNLGSGSVVFSYTRDFTIQDVHLFGGWGHSGAILTQSRAQYGALLNNSISGCAGGRGVHCDGGRHMRIIGNFVEGTDSGGLAFQANLDNQCPAGWNIVSGNYVKDFCLTDGNVGISATGCSDSIITGNHIYASSGNEGAGILIQAYDTSVGKQDANRNSIIGNRIYRSNSGVTAFAISILGKDASLFDNLPQHANDNTVEGNHISENWATGVNLGAQAARNNILSNHYESTDIVDEAALVALPKTVPALVSATASGGSIAGGVYEYYAAYANGPDPTAPGFVSTLSKGPLTVTVPAGTTGSVQLTVPRGSQYVTSVLLYRTLVGTTGAGNAYFVAATANIVGLGTVSFTDTSSNATISGNSTTSLLTGTFDSGTCGPNTFVDGTYGAVAATRSLGMTASNPVLKSKVPIDLAGNPLYLSKSSTFGIFDGTTSPVGTQTAGLGSVYVRRSGPLRTSSVYQKTTGGTDTTGWGPLGYTSGNYSQRPTSPDIGQRYYSIDRRRDLIYDGSTAATGTLTAGTALGGNTFTLNSVSGIVADQTFNVTTSGTTYSYTVKSVVGSTKVVTITGTATVAHNNADTFSAVYGWVPVIRVPTGIVLSSSSNISNNAPVVILQTSGSSAINSVTMSGGDYTGQRMQLVNLSSNVASTITIPAAANVSDQIVLGQYHLIDLWWDGTQWRPVKKPICRDQCCSNDGIIS